MLSFIQLTIVLLSVHVSEGVISPVPHQNPQCPLWYHYYNTTTHNCTCLSIWHDDLFCADGDDAFLRSSHILSYDASKTTLSLTKEKSFKFQLLWRNNVTKPGQILLPKDITRLNDYICAPLNRKGYLCSKCKEGFGPSMISSSYIDVCYDCTEASSWYGISLYLFLEFIPLTVFYLSILVFHIRVTSAPMICFIMYSQFIVITFHNVGNDQQLSQVKLDENGALRPISKIFLTFYGIFNLEFFRHVVNPFCINSQLTSFYIALLGYISAFYPFLLIILTWLCIELHDCNFRLIVALWKPFRGCFVRLRRGWDTKSDITDSFASFFILSYTKILYQTSLVFAADKVYNCLLTFEPITSHSRYVLSADTSIMIGSAKYICIAIITGLMCFVFNALPVLLLILYPFQTFRSALSKCRLNRITINHFVEKFHCYYRDGLDGGKDMRSFAGLHPLLRIMIVAPVLLLRSIFRFELWFLRGITLSIIALLIALCRPYKETYTNVLDTVLLFYLALFCHIFSSNQDCGILYFVPLMQALFLIPPVIFVIVIVIRLIRWVCRSQSQKLLLTYTSRAHVSSTTRLQRPIQPIATYGTVNS